MPEALGKGMEYDRTRLFRMDDEGDEAMYPDEEDIYGALPGTAAEAGRRPRGEKDGNCIVQ